MIDEREEAERVREAAGRPDGHATFEEPTGGDAVIARDEATITDTPEIVPDKPGEASEA